MAGVRAGMPTPAAAPATEHDATGLPAAAVVPKVNAAEVRKVVAGERLRQSDAGGSSGRGSGETKNDLTGQ